MVANRPWRIWRKTTHRRAAVVVWVGISMVPIVGFTALAIDMGYVYQTKSQLQRTTDAAAMAAASQLADADASGDAVYEAALTYARQNPIGQLTPTLAQSDVVLGHAALDADGRATFEEGQTPYDAVRVSVRMTRDSPNGAVPLFFGRALGVADTELSASAVAMLVPRDIAVVIDLSRSMDYDSQLRHESTGINIKEVWQDLGSCQYGTMTVFHNSYSEMPRNTNSDPNAVVNALGLRTVPYPYSKGSWKEYVQYVQGNTVNSAPKLTDTNPEYQYRYGLRTFVNYLLAARTLTTETPALANTRAQPVYAVKQAVEELCNYLILMDSGDHMSLHSYSDSGQTLRTMTSDLTLIIQTTYQQQAGGYGSQTNISAGLEKAITELTSSRARSCAKKVIFILTDGNANRPTNESTGFWAAIHSAELAASYGIQINCISLGSDANQSLMSEIAGIGKGVHFYVPTLDIAQYSEDLKRVFRTLGGKRPVRLIE